VERFGLERLIDLRPDEVQERVQAFRALTAFDHVPVLTIDA
jgi:hypothetical protein